MQYIIVEFVFGETGHRTVNFHIRSLHMTNGIYCRLIPFNDVQMMSDVVTAKILCSSELKKFITDERVYWVRR